MGDVLGIWDNPTRSVPTLMFRSSSRVLIVALAGLSSFLASCASLDSAAGSRLDLVKARGELLCGVSGKIPGFSFLSPDGRYTGLDVDIWFRLDLPPLERSEREGIEQPILVDEATGELDKSRWTDQHAELIRLAAQDPRVTRIFVDAAVKRDLCEREWEDRSWLQRIRPWPFHDEHLHVRLRCPEGSTGCVDQPPPPAGEGCKAILPTPRPEAMASPSRTLPAACAAVFRH